MRLLQDGSMTYNAAKNILGAAFPYATMGASAAYSLYDTFGGDTIDYFGATF